MVIRLTVTSLPLDSPPAVVEPFPGAGVVAIFHSGVSTPPCHTATLGNNASSQGFRKVYTIVHKPFSLELSCHSAAHTGPFGSTPGRGQGRLAAVLTPHRPGTKTHPHHHIKRKGFIELFARCLPPFSLFGHAPLLSKSVAIPVLASNTL